jgi:hypothetical protein
MDKKEHFKDLDKTSEIMFDIINSIRELTEDERDNAWTIFEPSIERRIKE